MLSQNILHGAEADGLPGLRPGRSAPSPQGLRKTKQEVRDKLRALHADLDAGLQPAAGYTVQAAVDDWLAHGLSGRSARTLALYRAGVKPLTDKIGAKPLRKLTAADVRSTLALGKPAVRRPAGRG
jgi:hypothetical protein